MEHFVAAWDGNVTSQPIPVFYQDAKQDRPTNDLQPFVRVQVQHAAGRQASLAGVDGQKLRINNGIFTVQLFTVLGEGLSKADVLAKIIQDAFEGQAVNGIWFRNVRVNEIGVDGDRYQTNILVDFTYDELK